MLISRLIVLRVRNILGKSRRENQTPTFNAQWKFSEYRAVYDIKWENRVQARQVTEADKLECVAEKTRFACWTATYLILLALWLITFVWFHKIINGNTKTEKQRNDLCVITICLVWRRPWEKEHSLTVSHTIFHLHPISRHQPVNKHAVMTILTHRARALCYKDSLDKKLEFLKVILIDNNFS